MATGKIFAGHSGDMSMSECFRGYLLCCLPSSKKDNNNRKEYQKHESEDSTITDQYSITQKQNHIENGKERGYADYGATASGQDNSDRDSAIAVDIGSQHSSIGSPSNQQNGSAYNYDNDNDTSSDSDDEVLRHYQQSIQRVPSSRSGNSRSKSSRKGEKEDLVASGKESERYSAVYDDATSQRSTAKDDTDGRRAAAVAASSVRLEDERSSLQSSSQVSQEHQQHAAYSNEAYQREQDMSPTGVSHTSTEQANSAGYADTASMSVGDPDQDEHLFDVSDLNADQEPVLISKCGSLEVTFNFDAAHSRMTVDVHQARDIPSKDRGGANSTQVRLLLLPAKKLRHKTKIKQGESPEFQEKFTFKLQHEEINNMGMRFRLYGCERMRRERMIGESIVGFASINQDIETTHWLTLEPRSNLSHGDSKFDVSSLARSDSASSTQSMQHGGMPELLIGLAYNGTTGRLSVEVIKGSNFRNMAMNRAPDTYVKLTLMSPNGQEIARSKTSVRRGQPNPLYKETFMFQVALFQLPDVTLMVSVYNKRSMKRKEMIGWFSLGYNNSGEEELSHWTDMRESKGEQVCRWHVLLEA